MRENERSTFIQSRIACAMIEMEAMKAENMERCRRGEAQAYSEDDFLRLITQYNIDHNSVLSYLND